MAVQQPQAWNHETIKAALRTKHGSLEALSIAWGFQKSAISAALAPRAEWPALERRVASDLQVPPHVLWPDRWHPDGTRRRPSIGEDHSRELSAPQRQKSQAA